MQLFKRRRIEAHIDMTPMIDTLLQLFLIFMVGATIASSSVDINLPHAEKNEAQSAPPRVVVVSIDAGGRIWLDNRPVARERLKADLQHIVSHGGELTVQLRADKSLLYEQIIRLMVEIRKTGASRVMLAYYPEE